MSGFNILHRNNLITLKQYFPGEYFSFKGNIRLVDEMFCNEMHLDVIINDSLVLHYDLSDSKHINIDALERCDFYFKRSFCSKYIEKEFSTCSAAILPLGLYFLALDNSFDYASLQRDIIFNNWTSKFKVLLKHLDKTNYLSYMPYLKFFEQLPKISSEPKVLFFAKVWNPNFDGEYELTEQDKLDRIKINEMRVKCIRQLATEFGNCFTGGIERSEYSLQFCDDLVIKDNDITKRSNYIKFMQEHDICVATAGLHNSIGGKFSEYMASSKAIVSESLIYALPGNISSGSHYLEFSSVDDCVSSVDKLLNDSSLRHEMMVNNFEYYHNFGRPDVLVKNSLVAALRHKLLNV
jgi:hypothetical protein